MDLESRLDKYKHVYKNPQVYLGLQHQLGLKNQGMMKRQSTGHNQFNFDEYFSKDTEPDKDAKIKTQSTQQVEAASAGPNSQLHDQFPKGKVFPEEFLVFKENQNILNKEISQKEIETELLRLEQYNFQINFSNFSGPHNSELIVMKGDGQKKIKVERKVLSSPKVLEPLEKIQPSDLDAQFYRDLNNEIIRKIHAFKVMKETNKNHYGENPPTEVMQEAKYAVHALFNEKTDPKANIEVQLFYPSHFQALRKLYCGSQNTQCESLFKSQKWGDVSGGKTKSDFYKSFDEKYVMKVISESEIKRFNEFALSYFEYMCRSFNQKCPTSIGKILGAFRITIKTPDVRQKQDSWSVIMMENLTIGIDPQKDMLAKYDLKGSMSRRYISTKPNDFQTTRLDTNFMEDRGSKPICMNYVMNRLMEIAIHNDTSFLHRYERIDYSLLVWIDHERKLIRVGIIDYIQNYSIEKQLESKLKQTFFNQGQPPTILNPKSYKERFKRAMSNYFMSILEDKPSKSFKELLDEQIEQKTEYEKTLLRVESKQTQLLDQLVQAEAVHDDHAGQADNGVDSNQIKEKKDTTGRQGSPVSNMK